MLKVKSDVDLKELEKFGFELKEDSYEYNTCEEEDGFSGFTIDTDDRIINNYSSVSRKNLDVMYDLIQAGLVEKVEEER